jgi:Lon protease-like protein
MVTRRPSRITDTWLLEFIEHPESCMWPEIRSMARELLERRRKDYAEAVRIRANWEKLEQQL